MSCVCGRPWLRRSKTTCELNCPLPSSCFTRKLPVCLSLYLSVCLPVRISVCVELCCLMTLHTSRSRFTFYTHILSAGQQLSVSECVFCALSESTHGLPVVVLRLCLPLVWHLLFLLLFTFSLVYRYVVCMCNNAGSWSWSWSFILWQEADFGWTEGSDLQTTCPSSANVTYCSVWRCYYVGFH